MSNGAHHDADQGPGLLSNAIAIIAFIIVIAIVIWGLLHLANVSTSWFTNLFPRSNPTLTLAAPATATSGTPVTVSWKYSGSEKGTFAFLYQCRTGVTLNDASGARILCGTTHPITGATSTVVFTPMLSGTASSTLPLSIVFFPAATTSKQVQGTASIALTAAAQGSVSPTPVAPETPSAPAAPQTPATSARTETSQTSYSGPADLRVRILSVTPGTLSTVQFDVANVGTSPSGSYSFTAYLPTLTGYTYHSPAQASLNPGDHIVNTLQFSDLSAGDVTIVLSPSKADYAGNNSDSQMLFGSAPAYDYPQYDYAYPTYQPDYAYPSYQPQYYGPGYPTLPIRTTPDTTATEAAR